MSDIINIEKELEALGAVKSNYGLIKLATKQIKSKLLLENEEMNKNPASFMNIFLENFGRISSQSFYEQMMYKNELNPSTAIKLRSLMNKMNDNMIASMYSTPSEMTFVLGYEYDKIIEYSKSSNYKLTVNKNCVFQVEGQEQFTLDHNINIIVSNPGEKNENIYAIFDTSDKLNPNSNLTNVNNVYISTQIIMVEGKKIFAMFLPTRQMYRTSTEFITTTSDPDFSVKYTDQLYGFEVDYMAYTSDKYSYMEGYPDGRISSRGYNFNIDLFEKSINIKFNRNPAYFIPSTGDKFRITVYTSKGKSGNFTIKDIFNQENNISFKLSQDRNNLSEDLITDMKPYISIKDGIAANGKDMKSFEEIRTMVIERGTNSSILTPGDLEKKVKSYGFSTRKIRNDIRCLEYEASTVLRNGSDIISSVKTDVFFNFEDIPLISEVKNRIISPKSVFLYDKEASRYNYLKNPESYDEYYNSYRAELKNEYMFPYHIRFISDTSVQADIFNMAVDNRIYSLDFLYFNKNTSYESSIINLTLNRDPVNENVEDLPGGSVSNPNTTGYYEFKFLVKTSSSVIDNLSSNEDDPIMKYRLRIKDNDTGETYGSNCYITDINEEESTVTVCAYIKTNDAINPQDKLCSKDYSLYPVPMIPQPIEYYFIGKNISLRVYAIEKNLKDKTILTEYDEILYQEEKDKKYFVSTVYKIDEMKLFEEYNDYISLISDIQIKQATYETYDEDVYETYKEVVYKVNDDGEVMYKDTPHPTIPNTTVKTPIILHNIGDVVMNELGEPTIKYRKGSAKRDEDGNYVYKTKESYVGIIKNIPVFDRIHSLGNGYKEVLSIYENMISDIKALSTQAPDGARITANITNTAGPGEYEIYNMSSSSWEAIDNIALSFDIGVKYKETYTEVENEIISSTIRDYVNDFNGISFSINNIFDEVKAKLPSIEYMILYKINQYPANIVQSIRKKGGEQFVKDRLSVKQVVDTIGTNLENKEVKFKPDIIIRVLS